MSPLKRNISIGFIIAFMVLLSIGSYSCKEKHDETAEDISAMSNEQLIAQKAELESLSIEKDKLMSELLASTTIINEIYTALEEVKGVPEGDQRTQILSKIHFLSDSLKSSHSKIKKSSKTIQGLQWINKVKIVK